MVSPRHLALAQLNEYRTELCYRRRHDYRHLPGAAAAESEPLGYCRKFFASERFFNAKKQRHKVFTKSGATRTHSIMGMPIGERSAFFGVRRVAPLLRLDDVSSGALQQCADLIALTDYRSLVTHYWSLITDDSVLPQCVPTGCARRLVTFASSCSCATGRSR